MKRFKWYEVFLLAVLALPGCVAEGKDTPERITKEATFTEEAAVMYAGAGSEVNGGYLLRVGEYMVYFDVESQKFVPFCFRAECDHQTVSGEDVCSAVILGDSCLRMGVYKDKLWYLKGITPEETALCSAELTGAEAEECYRLDVGITSGSLAVIYKDQIYMVDAKPSYDQYRQYVGTDLRLVSVDLDSGKLTEIEGLEEAQRFQYEIIGFWGGKIYYYYCPDDVKYSEGAVVYYDCETGEKGEIKLRKGILNRAKMNGPYLVCEKMNEKGGPYFLEVFDVGTGEEREWIALNEKVMDYQVYQNEVLLQADNRYYRYTFETGEYEAVENTKLTSVFWPRWGTEDGYLGMKIEHGMVGNEFAYMDRDSFDHGGESVPLTKDGVPIW